MISQLAFVGTLALAAGCSATEESQAKKSAKYADLVSFFHDWRTFEQPRIVDGAPDYSTEAMAAQHAALADYQHRLVSMDTTGMYKFPLSTGSADSLAVRLNVIPKLYKAARVHLDGNAKDLWTYGITDIRAQSRALVALSKRVAATNRISDSATYVNLFNASVTEYMAFLREHDILSVQPYMGAALRDEFTDAGLIPLSLIRWELTGNSDQIKAMTRLEPAQAR